MVELLERRRVMERPAPARVGDNLLLRALAPQDLAYIRPHLRAVELAEGDVIAAQDEAISDVCFIESGVASVANVMPDGARAEVAMIGREGLANAQVLLGCERAAHETLALTDGRALFLRAEIFLDFTARHRRAHDLFLRFVHVQATQTACTLVSHLRDCVEKRLSRWLLMCHDRLDGDEIVAIHKDIAATLGVRRATITDTLHILEGHGAVRSRRGRILVRDRARLEDHAGCAYGFVEQRYRALIGPFGRSAERREHAEPAAPMVNTVRHMF